MIVIACGLALFVSSQQAAVEKSLLNSEHVKAQNVMLGLKNDEIAAAKKQLESDEDEWVLLSWRLPVPPCQPHCLSLLLISMAALLQNTALELGPIALCCRPQICIAGVICHIWDAVCRCVGQCISDRLEAMI